jgi:hypothetical protein
MRWPEGAFLEAEEGIISRSGGCAGFKAANNILLTGGYALESEQEDMH